ncbi:MAG: hypothetical protein ACRD1L_04510, partial [Terriglobales bacterium]
SLDHVHGREDRASGERGEIAVSFQLSACVNLRGLGNSSFASYVHDFAGKATGDRVARLEVAPAV